jgi:hypothetical protein
MSEQKKTLDDWLNDPEEILAIKARIGSVLEELEAPCYYEDPKKLSPFLDDLVCAYLVRKLASLEAEVERLKSTTEVTDVEREWLRNRCYSLHDVIQDAMDRHAAMVSEVADAIKKEAGDECE